MRSASTIIEKNSRHRLSCDQYFEKGAYGCRSRSRIVGVLHRRSCYDRGVASRAAEELSLKDENVAWLLESKILVATPLEARKSKQDTGSGSVKSLRFGFPISPWKSKIEPSNRLQTLPVDQHTLFRTLYPILHIKNKARRWPATLLQGTCGDLSDAHLLRKNQLESLQTRFIRMWVLSTFNWSCIQLPSRL